MEEKYKIHAFYILSILVAIIIGLITVEWSAIPQLVDYIVFSLTITSLCLALLAIIYSMQSNTTFSQNMRSLETSTNALSNTSSKLSAATNELKSKVEDIPGIIQTVSDKVDETHTLLSRLSLSQDNNIDYTLAEAEIPDGLLDNFLILSSYNGLLILYIYSLSHKTNTPFEYKAMLELAGLEWDYSFSYTIACKAMGLLNYEMKKNDIWVIDSYNPYLAAHISTALDNKIASLYGGEENDENDVFKNEQQKLTNNKKEVEDYFDVSE